MRKPSTKAVRGKGKLQDEQLRAWKRASVDYYEVHNMNAH